MRCHHRIHSSVAFYFFFSTFSPFRFTWMFRCRFSGTISSVSPLLPPPLTPHSYVVVCLSVRSNSIPHSLCELLVWQGKGLRWELSSVLTNQTKKKKRSFCICISTIPQPDRTIRIHSLSFYIDLAPATVAFGQNEFTRVYVFGWFGFNGKKKNIKWRTHSQQRRPPHLYINSFN